MDAVPDLIAPVIHPDAPLREISIVRLTIDAILRMIGDGRLKPGQRLIETELSSILGIGRSPLREAFRILAERGAITYRPRRGNYVRVLAPAEIDDIYLARRCLEGFALDRLLAAPSEQSLSDLRSCVATMQRSVADNDIRAVIATDLDLHGRIVAAARSARLSDAYARIRFDLSHALLFARSCYGDLAAATRDHPPIIDAIAAGDLPLARERLFEHIEDGRRNLRTFFEGMKEETE